MALCIVYRIAVPYSLHEINMPDKHAVSGQVFVPSGLLAVFEQKEFICFFCFNKAAVVAFLYIFEHNVVGSREYAW